MHKVKTQYGVCSSLVRIAGEKLSNKFGWLFPDEDGHHCETTEEEPTTEEELDSIMIYFLIKSESSWKRKVTHAPKDITNVKQMCCCVNSFMDDHCDNGRDRHMIKQKLFLSFVSFKLQVFIILFNNIKMYM